MQREILLAYFCDGSNCEGRWNKLAEFLGNKVKGNSPIRTLRRIILKWIFNTYGRREWIGFIWLRRGTDAGLLCKM